MKVVVPSYHDMHKLKASIIMSKETKTTEKGIKRVSPFLKQQNNSQEAKQFINSQLAEINLYKKYKGFRNYAFYIVLKFR